MNKKTCDALDSLFASDLLADASDKEVDENEVLEPDEVLPKAVQEDDELLGDMQFSRDYEEEDTFPDPDSDPSLTEEDHGDSLDNIGTTKKGSSGYGHPDRKLSPHSEGNTDKASERSTSPALRETPGDYTKEIRTDNYPLEFTDDDLATIKISTQQKKIIKREILVTNMCIQNLSAMMNMPGISISEMCGLVKTIQGTMQQQREWLGGIGEQRNDPYGSSPKQTLVIRPIP